MMKALARGRGWLGLGALASGVVCPCHVLVGAAAFATGQAVLPPAAQDGVHAAYVPLAAICGALLLRSSVKRRAAR